MIATLLLAFAAGALSLLSPCTLPLLPIILATALSEHRWGPVSLAAGLALSFTVFGLIVALAGHVIGLTEDRVRLGGALIILAFGLVLLLPALQAKLTLLLEPISTWSAARFSGGSSGHGLAGQGLLGLALGAIWTPCVGPTLGAAALMASRGENIGQVSATMLAFGLGAGLPLAMLGLLPRRHFDRARGALATTGHIGRRLLGAVLIITAATMMLGIDKRLETALLKLMPAWLLDLTTRF